MKTANRSRILVVSPTFPYPLISGGKIRIYNILKQLSSSYKITLLALAESGEEECVSVETLSFIDSVITVPIKQTRFSQAWRLVSNLHLWLKGTPAEVLVKYSTAMSRELKKLLETNDFSALQIEYVQGMQYLPSILPAQTPIILVAHDVSFISQQRKAKVLKGFSGLFWRVEARRMKSYEQAIWRRCDCIAAMSDVDKKEILKLSPTSKVEVVPNGVKIHKNLTKNDGEVPTIIFVGWMRHLPNRDGLVWFIEKIWPSICEKNSDICLQVVGRGVSQSLLRTTEHDGRIQFRGYIENIEETVGNAWISIVPIRIGSGSRLKILESMSLGTPVISTAVGCEGLDVKGGENIEIADLPEEFAKLVLELVADQERRQKLASNALQLVEEKYSWERIGDKARHAIENITSGAH